jgi:hypothetical protein
MTRMYTCPYMYVCMQISISLDADVETFTFYSSGVYDDPACSNSPAGTNTHTLHTYVSM